MEQIQDKTNIFQLVMQEFYYKENEAYAEILNNKNIHLAEMGAQMEDMIVYLNNMVKMSWIIQAYESMLPENRRIRHFIEYDSKGKFNPFPSLTVTDIFYRYADDLSVSRG